MLSHGHSAASSRLEALKQRHAALSETIEYKTRFPAMDPLDIRRMKLEKLKIKDEMQSLREELESLRQVS